MKKNATALFLICFMVNICVDLKSENITLPPLFAIGELPIYGTVKTITITNSDTVPHRLYVMYQDSGGVCDPAESYKFRSDSDFLACLRNKITVPLSDTDEYTEQVFNRMVWELKSPNYVNHFVLTNEWCSNNHDSAYQRLYPIISFLLSFHSHQCGNVSTLMLIIAQRLGIPAYKMMFVQANQHVFTQYVRTGGDSVKRDGDHTCEDTSINPLKPSHKSSASDCFNNRVLAGNCPYVYVFCNGDTSGQDLGDSAEYHAYFVAVPGTGSTAAIPGYYPAPLMQTMSMDGWITLSGGASLSLSVPIDFVAVDTSTARGQSFIYQITEIHNSFIHNRQDSLAEVDSFIRCISWYQGISYDIAERFIVSKGEIIAFDGHIASCLNAFRYLANCDQNNLIPKATIVIPSSSHTTPIGTESLYSPLVITDVVPAHYQTDSLIIDNIHVLDNQFHQNFYSPSGGSSPWVNYQNIDYLRSGTVPANTSDTVTMYINVTNMNLMDGPEIETFGESSSTFSVAVTSSSSSVMPTSIQSAVFPNIDGLKAYPNPSNGWFNVYAAQIESITVFDVDGRMIPVTSVHRGSGLDVYIGSKGCYIVKAYDRNGNIIGETKVAIM